MFNKMFNLKGIASLIAQSNPQMNNILGQVQQMAKAGSDPTTIMEALEAHAPALKNNNIWNALRGKTPDEISAYASNLAKNMGVLKP